MDDDQDRRTISTTTGAASLARAAMAVVVRRTQLRALGSVLRPHNGKATQRCCQRSSRGRTRRSHR